MILAKKYTANLPFFEGVCKSSSSFMQGDKRTARLSVITPCKKQLFFPVAYRNLREGEGNTRFIKGMENGEIEAIGHCKDI